MAEELDEKAVKDIRLPAEGDLTVWDTKLKRFGVRVWSSGTKAFFIHYTSPNGARRRHTIGKFGASDWSAKAARSAAKKLLDDLDERGIDPRQARVDRREAPTVSDLAERYGRDHLPGKAPRSQRDDQKMIDDEILPVLGERKVADVHDGDVRALHRAMTARGAPVRANRALALLSTMFSLSLQRLEGEDSAWRDQAQGNPCKGVKRNLEEPKERYLSQAEIAALSDAIAARGQTPAVNAIRMILLSGCRPGEALTATWDQFDVEPGYWVKPSAHTKQRKTHRVPMTPGALQLVEKLRKDRKTSLRAKTSPFVFPGQKLGEPIKQLRSMWEELSAAASVRLWKASPDRQIAKLVADLERSLGRAPTPGECKAAAAVLEVKLPEHLLDARLYDLRHSFASVGAGGGLSLLIIGKLLGHTQARTTQRYAHLADDPLREAAKTIGSAIAGAGKPAGAVRAIRRVR